SAGVLRAGEELDDAAVELQGLLGVGCLDDEPLLALGLAERRMRAAEGEDAIEAVLRRLELVRRVDEELRVGEGAEEEAKLDRLDDGALAVLAGDRAGDAGRLPHAAAVDAQGVAQDVALPLVERQADRLRAVRDVVGDEATALRRPAKTRGRGGRRVHRRPPCPVRRARRGPPE